MVQKEELQRYLSAIEAPLHTNIQLVIGSNVPLPGLVGLQQLGGLRVELSFLQGDAAVRRQEGLQLLGPRWLGLRRPRELDLSSAGPALVRVPHLTLAIPGCCSRNPPEDN